MMVKIRVQNCSVRDVGIHFFYNGCGVECFVDYVHHHRSTVFIDKFIGVVAFP